MRRRRLSTARCAVAAVSFAALVCAAPAGAASLVYLDAASNVWVTSPDGAIKRQLTTDGRADSLYLSPSMQDDGTVVVPNQDDFTRVLNPDGTKKAGPWIKPTPASFNTALIWGDAHPTATFYLTSQYTAPLNQTPDPTVSLAALNAPGSSDCAVLVCKFGIIRPRFIPGTQDYTAITDGANPTTFNGEYVRVVKGDGTVVDWLNFTPPGGPPDLDFRNVDVSRTGNRVLVELDPEGVTTSSTLALLQGSGPPPATTTELCELATFAAGDGRPRWSPDGTQIAFSQPDGLHVSSAPTVGPGDTCVLANDHLVVPGGRDADWSPYTLQPSPAATTGGSGTIPTKPDTSTSGGSGASRLSSAKSVGASVRGGIVLKVVLRKAAQIAIRVQSLPSRAHSKAKAKLLGTVRSSGRAGSNTVTIKRVGGKRLRKGRYRLSITAGGATTGRVLVVAIRR